MTLVGKGAKNGFPFRSLTLDLFTAIKLVDPAAFLLPVEDYNTTPSSQIHDKKDIPKNDQFTMYFSDMQENDFGRHLVFYLRIHSDRRINQFRNNGKFYSYITARRLFIRPHSHPSRNVRGIGFVANMHPIMDSRESLTKILKRLISDNIVFSLNPTKVSHGRKDEALVADAIEILVDAAQVGTAHVAISQAFDEATELMEGKRFIPYPKLGQMTPAVYRHFIQSHIAHVSTMRSIMIAGIKDMSAPVIFGKETYANFFLFLHESLTSPDDDAPLFDSWQPMPPTSDGRIVLITDEPRLAAATKAINQMTDFMTRDLSFVSTHVRPNHQFRRVNRVTHTHFTSYIAALAAEVPLPTVTPDGPNEATTLTSNTTKPKSPPTVWKASTTTRRPPLFMDLACDNFPDLNPNTKAKRIRTSPTVIDTPLPKPPVAYPPTSSELEALQRRIDDLHNTFTAHNTSLTDKINRHVETTVKSLVTPLTDLIRELSTSAAEQRRHTDNALAQQLKTNELSQQNINSLRDQFQEFIHALQQQ
jgi:hypothetical protein